MDRQRTCIGCKRIARKGDLLRIARCADGTVRIDHDGKGPGRGAYVCSADCLGKALDDGSLARALRCRVGADVCERLRSEACGCGLAAAAKGSEG